jgi:hypothetical protein
MTYFYRSEKRGPERFAEQNHARHRHRNEPDGNGTEYPKKSTQRRG